MTSTNNEDNPVTFTATCCVCGRDYESKVDPARIVAMNASPAYPRCRPRDGMLPGWRKVDPKVVTR